MKAKYDIYIRKDLQAYLDKEANRSGLINDLLAKHFRDVAKKVNDFHQVGIKTTTVVVETDQGISTVVTPNKKDVERFRTRTTAYECKNGHLANQSGKCLQKGCKYA